MQRKVMVGTIVVWLLATAGSAVHRILKFSTFPRPPYDYEKQWDFQLTVFLLLEFPVRLLGLGLLLSLVWLYFRRVRTTPD